MATESTRPVDEVEEDRVFVFGSNLSGIHGAGAARFAVQNRGAIWGQAYGPQGQSYGIPTRELIGGIFITLPIDRIRPYVYEFLLYASNHPETRFEVTRIGCGYAGYKDADIKPLFDGAPDNCDLPSGWR